MLTIAIEENYFPMTMNGTVSKFGIAVEKLLSFTHPDWMRELKLMQKAATILEPRSKVTFLRSAMFSPDSAACLASSSAVISNVLSIYRLLEDIFKIMRDQGKLSADAQEDAVRVLEAGLVSILFNSNSSQSFLERIQERLLRNSVIADLLLEMADPEMARMIDALDVIVQKRLTTMRTMESLGTRYKTGSTTW